MKRILLAVCVWTTILAPGVHPQASGPHKHTPAGAVAAAEASHHACHEQERAALERGEGFGMALAADRNGYPGPRHVLELKAELKLTPE